MHNFKSYSLPIQVMVWLVGSLVMLSILDFTIIAFIMLFSDLNYQEITNNVLFWALNAVFLLGFITTIGTWLWED